MKSVEGINFKQLKAHIETLLQEFKTSLDDEQKRNIAITIVSVIEYWQRTFKRKLYSLLFNNKELNSFIDKVNKELEGYLE